MCNRLSFVCVCVNNIWQPPERSRLFPPLTKPVKTWRSSWNVTQKCRCVVSFDICMSKRRNRQKFMKNFKRCIGKMWWHVNKCTRGVIPVRKTDEEMTMRDCIQLNAHINIIQCEIFRSRSHGLRSAWTPEENFRGHRFDTIEAVRYQAQEFGAIFFFYFYYRHGRFSLPLEYMFDP